MASETRIGFVAGEWSPEMGMRCDMEPYTRGCECLENWEVRQTGGVRRRRGIRRFAAGLSGNGKLVPYIYSYGEAEKEVRFLVEVASTAVRVLSPSTGSVVALFQSGDEGVGSFGYEPSRVRWKQLNKLLFLVGDTCMPRVLEWDGNNWKFYEWEFRHMPYRYNHEERDWAVDVKYDSTDDDGNVLAKVSFAGVNDAGELPGAVGDAEYLQVSYWEKQQELGDILNLLLRNVTPCKDGLGGLGEAYFGDGNTTIKKWGYYVALGDYVIGGDAKYYSCIADFNKTSLVAGLTHPGNYTANFVECTNTGVNHSGACRIGRLEELFTFGGMETKVPKGTIIALCKTELELWQCIEEPPAGLFGSMSDYPEYFRRGISGGRARCKGAWSFYCSGVWYGEFEVLRNYESNAALGDWESRGIIRSGPFTAENNIISGDESDEECWLELRLNKLYAYGEGFDLKHTSRSDSEIIDELTDSFIPEDCGNRLIIDPFKRDVVLKCVKGVGHAADGEDDDGGVGSSSRDAVKWMFVDYSSFPYGHVVSKDWSWAAFGKRYGFPRHVWEFNSRLVFASTVAQPQTVWMSKVDDINNFSPGSFDDSSIWLTLNTPSQNAICWIGEKNYQLIAGTAFAEVGLTNPNKTVLTSSNAVCVKHGYVGSSEVPALVTANNILYVGRGGWRVYQFGYSLESDSLVSTDISVFASHIGEEHGGFVCAAMADKPDPVAYFVMGDGSVALCTYNGMQQVRAWHRWTTDGAVKDVCVLPDGKQRDRVFFLVVRDGLPVIGVMDDASPFKDWGSHDYHSRVVTTALGNVLQSGVRQQNAPKVRICWGQDFVYDGTNMWVSKDGFTTQYRPADYEGAVFKKGWREVLGGMEWGYEVKVGVDVCGDNACNILAIQG